jgi:hypothetical protein
MFVVECRHKVAANGRALCRDGMEPLLIKDIKVQVNKQEPGVPVLPAFFHYVITLSAYMSSQSRVSSFSRYQKIVPKML